jgi:hypothetical protein
MGKVGPRLFGPQAVVQSAFARTVNWLKTPPSLAVCISGPVEGRVQGNTLTLRERSGYGSEPLLNVKGDQITGTVAGTTLNLKRVR